MCICIWSPSLPAQVGMYDVSPSDDGSNVADARTAHTPLLAHVTAWHALFVKQAALAFVREYCVLSTVANEPEYLLACAVHAQDLDEVPCIHNHPQSWHGQVASLTT